MKEFNGKSKVDSRTIKEKLKVVFNETLKLKLFECEEVHDYNLFGEKVGLLPRHMIYIFYNIETTFGINIPEEAIVSGRFCTFNNIVEIIHEQLCNVNVASA